MRSPFLEINTEEEPLPDGLAGWMQSQHSVTLLKNNCLIMPHDTKINAIFVHIKAGDCSIPVHV